MIRTMEIDEIRTIIEKFENFFEEKGYRTYTHVRDKYLGTGSQAIHKDDDTFRPIFTLSVGIYPRYLSIHVEDRNGNNVCSGNTAAIYMIDNIGDLDENVLNRYNKLLEDVYNKYSVYSRENRLDFIFNNLDEDRQNY